MVWVSRTWEHNIISGSFQSFWLKLLHTEKSFRHYKLVQKPNTNRTSRHVQNKDQLIMLTNFSWNNWSFLWMDIKTATTNLHITSSYYTTQCYFKVQQMYTMASSLNSKQTQQKKPNQTRISATQSSSFIDIATTNRKLQPGCSRAHSHAWISAKCN